MTGTHLFLGLGLLASLAGCKKDPYSVIVPVGFLPSVTLTPSSRTMHRGDTLWLEANFSDSLLDKNSGRRYRVRPQDVPLHSAIFYEQLLGVGQKPAGIAPSFRLVEKVGRASVQGSFTSSFETVYDGHYYHARIGLIPTKACVTAISLLLTFGGDARGQPLLPFIQLPPDAQGREQEAVLDDSFYVINGGQANNFDLFSQNTQAFSLISDPHPGQVLYEQKSTFTVEVK